MTRMVDCVKLGQKEEGLDFPPIPGELGEKIYNQVSKKAWQLWLQHQTMLINEYRLSLMEKEAQDFLKKELERFFFGEGSEKPSGYVPTPE